MDTTTARAVIARAEADCGELPYGMKSDLLIDQGVTNQTSHAHAILDAIEREDGLLDGDGDGPSCDQINEAWCE